MTLENIVEQVQQLFPNIQQAQILKEIDIVQKEFVEETGLLEAEGQLEGIDENTMWQLPSDFKVLKRIDYYDVQGYPLDPEGMSYDIERGNIYFKSTTGEVLLQMPENLVYIVLQYLKVPGNITALTSVLDIPQEFHNAILAKTIERMYARFPVDVLTKDGPAKMKDWSAVQYWKGEYRNFVIRAKQQANQASDQRPYDIKIYMYPHDIEEVKRNMASIQTITPYRTWGTTAQRPVFDAGTNIGFEYFDTDFNAPVYWNGTEWV